MKGIQICRKVREQARELYTYIILLTSKGEMVDILSGMESGADDYLTKPVNQNKLRMRLNAGKRIVEMNKELLLRCREAPKIWVSLILFALAAFLAYGRWVISPP